MIDHIIGQKGVSTSSLDLVQAHLHTASSFFDPRATTKWGLTEEVLSSFGVAKTWSIDHKKRERLDYCVEEDPMANSLLDQLFDCLPFDSFASKSRNMSMNLVPTA
jgi:hypothetical protein